MPHELKGKKEKLSNDKDTRSQEGQVRVQPGRLLPVATLRGELPCPSRVQGCAPSLPVISSYKGRLLGIAKASINFQEQC